MPTLIVEYAHDLDDQDDVASFLHGLGDVAVETAIGAFNELYR